MALEELLWFALFSRVMHLSALPGETSTRAASHAPRGSIRAGPRATSIFSFPGHLLALLWGWRSTFSEVTGSLNTFEDVGQSHPVCELFWGSAAAPGRPLAQPHSQTARRKRRRRWDRQEGTGLVSTG